MGVGEVPKIRLAHAKSPTAFRPFDRTNTCELKEMSARSGHGANYVTTYPCFTLSTDLKQGNKSVPTSDKRPLLDKLGNISART